MPQPIPERWLPQVREHVRAAGAEERDHLLAFDFPSGQSVRVAWEDGSYALFRYAFALFDHAAGEAAVFTEHRGYHYLSLAGAEVEVLRSSDGGAWTPDAPDLGPASPASPPSSA